MSRIERLHPRLDQSLKGVFRMKMFRSALALSLMFAAGTALAAGHDPQTTKPASNTAQQVPVDHSKMKMDGAMPMDHGKMADAEFVKFDQNKDGKISKSEVPAKHAMTAHFGMLDADKDGSLSQAEFAKHHEM
ncbi:hypothetical protein [Novilysobacter arseniciresistens]|uniref:hypothetical protein n=1 Tax=Novilysobacter arseniciresistens TaxID=1385522 RepID=UPI001EF11BF6|nr:hypothetical protein [Lysobacter arseniciresistens]